MSRILKVGNAQAFWGDRNSAAATLASEVPDLDVITLDYLAEVSMSILAIQKEKDPNAGYAKDFVDVITSLAKFWKEKRPLKVITNAGGLNPKGCAIACQEALHRHGIYGLKIGVVSGDDVKEHLLSDSENPFKNLDNDQAVDSVRKQIVTANAYLGSKGIVEALNKGADIVITGRVADPCLVAGACIAHHKWALDDYDKIASAIIAGHLIECGTQVTGGFSTNWSQIASMIEPGYPYVEIEESGSFIITKSEKSDGAVTLETVKEQLLYEIQDPDNYLCPDATVSFLSLELTEKGTNRIEITGAKGRTPPATYKVSATYRDGYKVEGMIAIFGRNAREKGYECGNILRDRLKNTGYNLEGYSVECIGSGDIVPGIFRNNPMEVMLRIAARDPKKEALEQLAKEIAPLVTSGPQGVTGYSAGRPKVRPLFSFWPTLIDPEKIKLDVEILEV